MTKKRYHKEPVTKAEYHEEAVKNAKVLLKLTQDFHDAVEAKDHDKLASLSRNMKIHTFYAAENLYVACGNLLHPRRQELDPQQQENDMSNEQQSHNVADDRITVLTFFSSKLPEETRKIREDALYETIADDLHGTFSDGWTEDEQEEIRISLDAVGRPIDPNGEGVEERAKELYDNITEEVEMRKSEWLNPLMTTYLADVIRATRRLLRDRWEQRKEEWTEQNAPEYQAQQQ